MRAVILCAGEGTRMRPLTYSQAKHLIPIANKPVIDLILQAVKDAGIREIGIVVSPGAR
ncbi:NTP transferase domain-containing protein, partial [Candidatus Bipolaricaulota bacterium]|nr:NTP transferase domain-containing protein [Candidatus Bipolaricaulota bacterium]